MDSDKYDLRATQVDKCVEGCRRFVDEIRTILSIHFGREVISPFEELKKDIIRQWALYTSGYNIEWVERMLREKKDWFTLNEMGKISFKELVIHGVLEDETTSEEEKKESLANIEKHSDSFAKMDEIKPWSKYVFDNERDEEMGYE